jgi:hypothetical protein
MKYPLYEDRINPSGKPHRKKKRLHRKAKAKAKGKA